MMFVLLEFFSYGKLSHSFGHVNRRLWKKTYLFGFSAAVLVDERLNEESYWK